MDKSVFESTRGGVKHRYEVRGDGLHYSAGTHLLTDVVVPWEDFRAIEPMRGGAVLLIRSNKQKFGVWLPPGDLEAFLRTAIAAWGKKDKDTARKAAFDYGTTEPSVGWIWLVLSLSFPGMLAATLLTDGYHTLTCTHELEHSQIAQAHVTKIKKNRRASFIWTMEFQTARGQAIHGTREAPHTDEDGHPPETVAGKPTNEATVIYSTENPNCWDISLTPGVAHVNEKQRHFTVLMDLFFGWTFMFVALLASWFSVQRIARKHPAREAVRIAGSQIK